jgi:hypothetical protein
VPGPERWVDQPLEAGELDEKDYVKRFRDVDIEPLLPPPLARLNDPVARATADGSNKAPAPPKEPGLFRARSLGPGTAARASAQQT